MATDPRSDHDTSLTLMMRVQKDPADSGRVGRVRPALPADDRGVVPEVGLAGLRRDDVTQEVLVKLLAAIRQFQYDPSRSFRSWLKTVTQHALTDFAGPANESTSRRARAGGAARRIVRRHGRPGAEARRGLRRRDARTRHAPGREAGQAEELAGVPAHRDRGALRVRRPRSSSRCRSPSSTSPRTGCRRCSRRRS